MPFNRSCFLNYFKNVLDRFVPTCYPLNWQKIMNLIGTKLNFKREQGKLVQRLFSPKSHYYTTQHKQWKDWKQMLSRRFPSMAFCITTTALSLRSPPPTKILTLTFCSNPQFTHSIPLESSKRVIPLSFYPFFLVLQPFFFGNINFVILSGLA